MGGLSCLTCWKSAAKPVYSSSSLTHALTHASTHALADALVDVLRFIDGSEDEQMNPDGAVKVLEGILKATTFARGNGSSPCPQNPVAPRATRINERPTLHSGCQVY
ncbi:hypothetical protein [Streptomyces sp. NPDC058613]|uniref:hypothetical protein n=1 Tax=Streptomyces sp. NPDC058613 TaxID=3346556 RepID=UPI003652B9B4